MTENKRHGDDRSVVEIVDIPEADRPARRSTGSGGVAQANRRARRRAESGPKRQGPEPNLSGAKAADRAARRKAAKAKTGAAEEAMGRAVRRKAAEAKPEVAEEAAGRAARQRKVEAKSEAAVKATVRAVRGKTAREREAEPMAADARAPRIRAARASSNTVGSKKRSKENRKARVSNDIFLEEWDAPVRKKKARRKKSKKTRRLSSKALAVNLLLTAGILAMLVLGGMLARRHSAFAAMKQVVEAQTFYEGTTVDGMNVSGLTLAAAEEYWQQRIEPAYADRRVTLDDGSAVTARELGYQSDYQAVLTNAWSAGRRGSLEQRYHSAVRRQSHPAAFEITRSLYSDAELDAYVQSIADRVYKPARDAAIQSFDVEQYAFVFTESEEGRRLDADGLKRDIVQALEAGGGGASVVVETVMPAVTTEEVSSKYGMITSAVTNASSSSSNRLKNIERAISLINGKCMKPGEVFSFNETVGQRTTDRGFRKATAYSGGDVTEEIGGGICQVSTTLFNAAVKADMKIVERHNHSLTVGYVDKGKDATVNWKSQDLKFKNTSQDDVYICCFLSKDKRVRFGIFGRLLENGETITLEGVTRETIKYDTKYVPSAFLAPGQTQLSEPGKNGYKADAYKIRWDAQGNEISRELLCKSYYKSRDEVIQYGA